MHRLANERLGTLLSAFLDPDYPAIARAAEEADAALEAMHSELKRLYADIRAWASSNSNVKGA